MNEDVEFGRQQNQKSLPYRSGATVFVPAGVPHTYSAGAGARYLIILERRLGSRFRLIVTLPTSVRFMDASVPSCWSKSMEDSARKVSCRPLSSRTSELRYSVLNLIKLHAETRRNSFGLLDVSTLLITRAGMAELADAADSKSAEVHPSWGFDPPSRHQITPADLIG